MISNDSSIRKIFYDKPASLPCHTKDQEIKSQSKESQMQDLQTLKNKAYNIMRGINREVERGQFIQHVGNKLLTSQFFGNVLPRRLPDQNLRTRGIKDGLFS
jgi:hypothetical protein